MGVIIKINENLVRFLTISASEYVEMVGKKLKDYVPFGFHIEQIHEMTSLDDEIRVTSGNFSNAEVIIGFRVSYGPFSSYITGTALIPKEITTQKNETPLEQHL